MLDVRAIRLSALLLAPVVHAANHCQPCHPKEVAAYSHSHMSRSLRRPGMEPPGAFTSTISATTTRFTIRASDKGVFQRMERFGGSAEYRVAYAIGSGNHASSYLIQVGDHLFQSPICYYTGRHAYDLAPGFEQVAEPDFTRPVGAECVLCHSGRPQPISGTTNQYKRPLFLEESISCERCHGPSEEHLKRPTPGSIVNPSRLSPAERDSICEQCHLTGVTQRILNPGKNFEEFRPGQRLEEVFTVYTRTGAGAFKVISHSEQLAQSACARNSEGKLWCGTCHDPHPQSVPTAKTYDSQCQACHKGKLGTSHTADTKCVSCHMMRRPTQDGGHTVFTDHRIRQRPEPDAQASGPGDLKAWREPEPALQGRNLALAYVNAGIYGHSPADVERGYKLLVDVQKSTPGDVDVLRTMGRALLLAREPRQALLAFEQVLRMTPDRATSEEDVGIAYFQSGQLDSAAAHLERALQLDPLQLSAGTALQAVYRKQGYDQKADALAERMRRSMLNLLRGP